MTDACFGNPDVIVVGAGNAACCAALAAREAGASVIMLEAAPQEDCGGNSRYVNGAIRFLYRGIDDLLQIVPDITAGEIEDSDFGSYSSEQFLEDVFRVTQYRSDPDLVEVLVSESFETVKWMRTKGVRFEVGYGTQAYKVDGKHLFRGGVVCETWSGGPGLVTGEHKACERDGIRIFYETPAVGLITSKQGVCGIRARCGGEDVEIRSGAAVLACGGFESNAEMRARYLGPSWDLAKVRGTRFNTGQGLRMALDIGALPYGHWSGCHSVSWDLNAPPFGDLRVGGNYQKHTYPLGIMVNARGERFVDEGADLRNYTYAKYGAAILGQPGMFAWQIFDKKVSGMLRDEYRIKEVTKVTAKTLEELASKLDGVDAEGFLREIRDYNKAVRTDIPFNHAITIKDGRRTEGLRVNKSNWSNTIDEPPFEAYAVTCGITFTFGGLKITTKAQVEDFYGKPIAGLFAAGEMVGGLFYNNYPGGTGLTSGAVFGKIAGEHAAARALGKA